MTKPANLESIEKTTSRSWMEWQTWLNKQSASKLPHKALATLISKELDGVVESPGWWAQGIAVAYEQAIGRRAPGQRSDGTFEVSVSKTLHEERGALFTRIVNHFEARTEFDGHEIANVRTSTTPIRSYWKCSLAGGDKVAISIEAKGKGRSLLVIIHANLATSDAAASWKSYWQRCIKELCT